MTVLLVDKELLSKSHDEPTAQAARALTLTAIRELDSKRNQQLTIFLIEAGLVQHHFASPELLRSANLSGAQLGSANFFLTQLSGSDLSGSDLSGSDLSGSDLSGADLSGADLSSANLNLAQLYGANLVDADFCCANPSAANLNSADLHCADLYGATLENIQWNEYTNWENVKNLDKAHEVPKALKQQLGLD
ncbi:pentapeptide repeat-containing protein [Lusitaniella coriacea LEGE 07157]|uniref:Pentapeptide repeat-containing protein n=2 Tax=Lusitaniella TaxID=1983104 RepID=A0A8J7DV74_9CYAN|nr:pentapeptide repeat-containing protein [Lusitaniella coriacea LEGE 07157]